MKTLALAVIAASVAFSSNALAVKLDDVSMNNDNTVLLGVSKARTGGSSTASIDFVSSGKVAAFNMTIELPAGVEKVNTASCVAEVPKSHVAVCKSLGNKVSLVVYSPQNQLLPAGVIPVGKVSYRGGVAGMAAKVLNVKASSPEANQKQSVKVQVEQF